MHYCVGKYVFTSINKEAKSCCDGTGGCCENKTIHIEIENYYVSQIQIDNPKIVEMDVLFPIIFALYFELLPELNDTFEVYSDTSPPPTIQTRLSLLQTYLC
ncbi:MAG: hypothetical protein JEZ09_21610 [Salinivirgaceae bacterium]|nr:hypothetical protein [Salinivirgaceae bacterium]